MCVCAVCGGGRSHNQNNCFGEYDIGSLIIIRVLYDDPNTMSYPCVVGDEKKIKMKITRSTWNETPNLFGIDVKVSLSIPDSYFWTAFLPFHSFFFGNRLMALSAQFARGINYLRRIVLTVTVETRNPMSSNILILIFRSFFAFSFSFAASKLRKEKRYVVCIARQSRLGQ